MHACAANEQCAAFTFQSETGDCLLKSKAESHWDETAGFESGYKCAHVPYSSPERDPDSYLWESCQNQVDQADETMMGAYIPQCDSEGGYLSEQCHASTGHCWCVNEFGEQLTEPAFGAVEGGCTGPTPTPTTEETTTSSFGSTWNPSKCGDCGCCCRPEHIPYCNYDIIPYLRPEWKCESGDYFVWNSVLFDGHQINSSEAESIDHCQFQCTEHSECKAFTYKESQNTCILRSAADAIWGESAGYQSAYQCDHVPPSESPPDDPHFYLWNSCDSHLAQVDQERDYNSFMYAAAVANTLIFGEKTFVTKKFFDEKKYFDENLDF